MSEERKSTPQSDALRDCASDLRRFARALVGPVSTRTADALVQAATARVSGSDRLPGDPRERAFGEIVRLNRRRVREKGHPADAGGAAESERRDSSLANLISAMPLDERETLLVVALAEFGYETAARILDVPVSSVVSRLMRARARLEGARSGPASRPGHLRLVK